MTNDWSVFAKDTWDRKYRKGEETWADTAYRVAYHVLNPHFPELVDDVAKLIEERKFFPGGRYLYSAGNELKAYNNCFLMQAEDSREGWGEILDKASVTLMTGGGVGIDYSKLRGSGAPIRGTGGTSSGPIALMQMVNEVGRHVMMGGSRRSALIALLKWNHPDIMDFIRLKDWPEVIREQKAQDFNFWAPMDGTNISVILDGHFFKAYAAGDSLAREVYQTVVRKMLKTGEPGFTVDVGENEGENLRNPCGEITSSDSDDVCNLGSINLPRIENLEEMARVVRLATAFLLAGTLEADLPYDKVYTVREKNRRLGLGVMGLHEWLTVRGKPYAPDVELSAYLAVYRDGSRYWADTYADRLGVSRPVKVRAIAPTGTIGILAETTTGIEPLFATAYKRRYLKGKEWHYQYVIDEGARRMVAQGADPEEIETAYSLAATPVKRLAFQAWVQGYVDHAISSTLNLPRFSEQSFSPEEFEEMLIQYLPYLRGVTAYPNGARGGQPLTVVPYQEALDWEGFEYAEVGNEDACPSGVCGV